MRASDIDTTWSHLLRHCVGGWLLLCLPLGLWLCFQLNTTLQQSQQQQRYQQLQQSTQLIQQTLAALVSGSSENLSSQQIQQTVINQLPFDVDAVWLRNTAGKTLPLVLPTDRSSAARATEQQAQWVPLTAPHQGWQLGVHYTSAANTLHPLTAATLGFGLLSWMLLSTAWWRWGRNQRQLSQITQRFQQTLDFAGDALFYVRPKNGQIVHANAQISKLLGYAVNEVRHVPPATLFKRSGRRRYFQLVKQVQREGYGEAHNLIFCRKDGSTFYGSVHARLGKLGRETIVHGVLRDVTKARETELELRQKNRDLRLLNRLANQLAGKQTLNDILSLCLQTLCQSFSAAGGGIYLMRQKNTYLKLVSHLNLNDDELFAIHELTPQNSIVGQAATSGQPYLATDLATHPLLASPIVAQNGWQSLVAIPLAAQAQVVGVLFLFDRKEDAFSRDDTQLLLAAGNQIGTAIHQVELNAALEWQSRLTQASNRELEKSRQKMDLHLSHLEESNRALERLDSMKNSFLSLASHELRTPLTYILPAIELLEQKLNGNDKETAQLLDAIDQGGRRLKYIVGDLLQMARIEARDIYLAREAIDLNRLFDNLYQQVQQTLQQRQLTLFVPQVPADLTVFGDKDHLHNLVYRLLENAIKFTPDAGEIFLEVCRIERHQLLQQKEHLVRFNAAFFQEQLPDAMAQITVRDTGIGIDPEDCVRIFDKFTNAGDIREHFTSTTSFGGQGVGLGLALTKGLIEIQGGMVWVESERENERPGAAFHLLMPLEAPE